MGVSMRKFILSALILLIAIMGLNAKAVDKSTAEKVALNWINQLDTHKSFSNRIVKTDVSRKDQLSLLYTIHFQNKGFVIVSADDNVEPILGYSLNSKADESQMSPATQAFLNHYASKIDVIVSKKLQNQRANRKWDQLLNTNYQRTDTRDVEPLLMTSWDQGELYNASCPPDPNGPDGHVWAGCVATAMGQIMKYWAYPAQGTGSHYYAHPVYGTLYADFGNTTYNWSEMPNELWEYNTQVSTLLYHLGVSVDMDYGPNGSGAFSEDARDAFVNYFSYSSAASYLYKTDYSDIEWSSLLRSQLDSYKPVYYAGRDASNESGHAFVCDGYSGTDYFHFNWGWSGIYNGYFYLNDLTPGYEGNEADFSYVQRAIVNIEPANPIVNDGILVWEGVSGGSSYSGQYIYNYLQSMQAPSVYTNSFPVSLIGFDAVVLSFGNYGSDISTSFTDEMATRVIDYLNAGGRVYLEGGDALGYDQSDNGTLLSMFGIAESTDGSSLILENLTGQPGSLADSMLFVSSSQAYNGWIDIFTPSSGIVVFKHANGQDVAIQNVMSNGAKTMCFSYALAELNDERNNTRIDLLNRIGLFFGQAAPEGDMYEPDNTYMQAHYIMPGQTQNHSIKPVADVDWVKFDVTEVPQTVIINTDGIGSGDTRLYLYASDGVTELAYNDDYYGLYSSINYTFTEPGTYYAMVDEYGNNNVIEYYTIHLEFQQPEPIIAPSNLVFDLNQINGHVNLEWMHGTSNWVYENFDDGVADNFLGLDDRFSISNGRLIMNGWSNDTWAGTFYNYDFSNFAMEFEITRHQSEGSLTNSMGAFFRANEFSEYTMSGYLFNIVAAGMYSVFVINDNSPVVLIDWTQSEYINTGLGSSNVVTLFAFGPNVDIYINSQYVNSFTDYTFSSGKAGLCTYDSVNGPNQVSWDYFAAEEMSDYRQVTKAKPLTPVFTSGNFKKSPLVPLSDRKNNLVQGMTQL